MTPVHQQEIRYRVSHPFLIGKVDLTVNLDLESYSKTRRFARIASSIECAIDFTDHMRCAPGHVLITDVV